MFLRRNRRESLPKLTFNASEGRLSYLLNGRGFSNASFSLEVEGSTLKPGDADKRLLYPSKILCDDIGVKRRFIARYVFTNPEVEWEVYLDRYVERPYTILGSKVRNRGNSEVQLGRCRLLDVEAEEGGGVILQGDLDRVTFFVETGTQRWSRVKRITSDDGEHVSQTIGHIYDPAAPICLNSSFVTFDKVKTEVAVRCDREKEISRLEAYCNFDGFTLKPGVSTRAERLLLDLREDPYASLEAWAEIVNRIYKPKIWERLPTGWVGWAWVDHFKDKPYEEIVMENVKAIEERFAGFGIEYIWVSIGNLWRDTPGFWLRVNRRRFPHGLRWLVEELKKRGLKLGLWCAPFWIPDKPPSLFEKMKDAVLKKGGECVVYPYGWPYGYWSTFKKAERPIFYCLDPSHPKVKRWLRKVFRAYRRMGIRYFMVDFLISASGSTPGTYDYDEYYNKNLVKGPEVYRAGLEVIREESGPETYLLASTSPTLQNVGLVDGVRVGPDYGEGRPVIPVDSPYASFTRGDGAYKTYRPRNWERHKYTGCKMAASYFTHRRLYINDSCNLLTVDGDVPLNEAQISATLFGICGGPMMLGDNIPTIKPERLALIKKCLPRYPEIAKPVDLFTSVYPEDYPKTFNLAVKRPWGSWNILAIFNYDEPELNVEVGMESLGLNPEKEYLLYDFWDKRFLGNVKHRITVSVPPHSVKLLSVHELVSHPWVISTDMHITQGAVEMLDLRWSKVEGTLSGVCERPEGEKGTLVIYMPDGYSIEGSRNIEPRSVEDNIVEAEIEFKERTVHWKLFTA